MKIESLRSRVLRRHEEVNELTEDAKILLQELQDRCTHVGHIVYSPYKSGIMYDHAEIYLCTFCGLQESGWNPPTLHLGYGDEKRKYEVTRDELYAKRRIISNGIGVGIK